MMVDIRYVGDVAAQIAVHSSNSNHAISLTKFADATRRLGSDFVVDATRSKVTITMVKYRDLLHE